MTYQRIPIEILAKGKPHCILDVPVLGELTPEEIKKAERRAFWTIAAQQEYDLDEITARYAPEFAEEVAQ